MAKNGAKIVDMVSVEIPDIILSLRLSDAKCFALAAMQMAADAGRVALADRLSKAAEVLDGMQAEVLGNVDEMKLNQSTGRYEETRVKVQT